MTLVTWHREELFGEVVNAEMRLNKLGEIVKEEGEKTGKIRKEIIIDDFVVMPNHVHGIVLINEYLSSGVGASGQTPLQNPLQEPLQELDYPPHGPRKKSIGAMITGFKSSATVRINKHRQLPGHPVWQRNYYDPIFRHEKELQDIQQYILSNPLMWKEDPENPNKPLGEGGAIHPKFQK